MKNGDYQERETYGLVSPRGGPPTFACPWCSQAMTNKNRKRNAMEMGINKQKEGEGEGE